MTVKDRIEQVKQGQAPEAVVTEALEEYGSTLLTNDANTDKSIQQAYKASQYFKLNKPRWKPFDTDFEHGQWWVQDYPKDHPDKDTITYSVVDTNRGLDFEELY